MFNATIGWKLLEAQGMQAFPRRLTRVVSRPPPSPSPALVAGSVPGSNAVANLEEYPWAELPGPLRPGEDFVTRLLNDLRTCMLGPVELGHTWIGLVSLDRIGSDVY